MKKNSREIDIWNEGHSGELYRIYSRTAGYRLERKANDETPWEDIAYIPETVVEHIRVLLIYKKENLAISNILLGK